jgi:7-cyano-7-deazaguanine synthase
MADAQPRPGFNDNARSATKPDATPSAVVLLSGGADSATTLAVAQADGFACFALTIEYGQRHAAEIDAAREIAADLGVAGHKVYPLDLRLFGGSALTDTIDVPKDRESDEISAGIPVTYVPARNLIFLSLAAAYAETIGARDLYVGINAVDYSGYPDCRPEFIAAFEETVNLATKMGVESGGGEPVRVHTPLVDLTKAEIFRLGVERGVDFGRTHSCYDPAPDGSACGRCDSCVIRRRGFEEAGLPDPTRYAERVGDAS